MSTSAIDQKLRLLEQYSACDVCPNRNATSSKWLISKQVSDALVKLQKPSPGRPARGGFLADISTTQKLDDEPVST